MDDGAGEEGGADVDMPLEHGDVKVDIVLDDEIHEDNEADEADTVIDTAGRMTIELLTRRVSLIISNGSLVLLLRMSLF